MAPLPPKPPNTRLNAKNIPSPITTPTINDTQEPSNKELMIKLNEIIQAMEFQTKTFEELFKRVTNIEKESKTLRDENINLSQRLATIESFFFQQQQEQLQNHITIHGIPTKANEDLTTTIINTLNTLDVTVIKENITHVRRMNTNNNNNTSPPIIVVQLNATNIKQLIMQKFKSNGPILLNQISNVPHTEHKKIYINEYLNNYYKQLYENAKTLKTSHNFKFIWFKNGTIYARKNETSQIFRVKHQNDIIAIKNQEPTS